MSAFLTNDVEGWEEEEETLRYAREEAGRSPHFWLKVSLVIIMGHLHYCPAPSKAQCQTTIRVGYELGQWWLLGVDYFVLTMKILQHHWTAYATKPLTARQPPYATESTPY